jgi:hypothetical protein
MPLDCGSLLSSQSTACTVEAKELLDGAPGAPTIKAFPAFKGGKASDIWSRGGAWQQLWFVCLRLGVSFLPRSARARASCSCRMQGPSHRRRVPWARVTPPTGCPSMGVGWVISRPPYSRNGFREDRGACTLRVTASSASSFLSCILYTPCRWFEAVWPKRRQTGPRYRVVAARCRWGPSISIAILHRTRTGHQPGRVSVRSSAAATTPTDIATATGTVCTNAATARAKAAAHTNALHNSVTAQNKRTVQITRTAHTNYFALRDTCAAYPTNLDLPVSFRNPYFASTRSSSGGVFVSMIDLGLMLGLGRHERGPLAALCNPRQRGALDPGPVRPGHRQGGGAARGGLLCVHGTPTGFCFPVIFRKT